MRIITLVFLFALFGITTKAQINYKFLQHLYTNNLTQEHAYYLHTLSEQNVAADTLHYLQAKFNLLQRNDTLFMYHYGLSVNLFNADVNALRYANYYYLQHANNFTKTKWFATSALTPSTDSVSMQVLNMYTHLQNNTPILTQLLNQQLTQQYISYVKLNNKKPIVAACLSTVVPGLGKLYGQRPNSALITFVGQCLYGLQTYETVHKLGVKNGFSIFSLSFFSFFYLSNIYGSYHDLKALKQQRKKQLHLNVQKYLQLNYPASLY